MIDGRLVKDRVREKEAQRASWPQTDMMNRYHSHSLGLLSTRTHTHNVLDEKS